MSLPHAIFPTQQQYALLALLLLPLTALAAVTLADLSQLSRGEVERIWLPFAVWIGAAAVGDRRPWLAAQAATGLVVQAALVSPW